MSEKQETKICKHCKTEIAKNAKVCPNCNKKQSGMLKWVIIAVIIIGIGGAITQKNGESPDENAYVQTMETPIPSPTVAPSPEPTETPAPEPTEAPSPELTEAPATESSDEISVSAETDDFTYVLNTGTHKIHRPNCSSVPKIKPENYATTDKSLDELLDEGYTKCGNCW